MLRDDVELVDASIDHLYLYGLVIEHPDRALLVATIAAEDVDMAIASAVEMAAICEGVKLDGCHIRTVVFHGSCDAAETFDACDWFERDQCQGRRAKLLSPPSGSAIGASV